MVLPFIRNTLQVYCIAWLSTFQRSIMFQINKTITNYLFIYLLNLSKKNLKNLYPKQLNEWLLYRSYPLKWKDISLIKELYSAKS